MVYKKLSYLILVVLLAGCYDKEELNEPVKDTDSEPTTALDIYIQENFTDPYQIAIRYRFVDRYVDPGERVAPPRLEVVRPMLDFIEKFWIDPYLEVPNGEDFFKKHVPAELIFLGGFIYNPDGTVTLGTADAGARITFTNVNAIDEDDVAWRDLQLQTVYHEFAHIVHQRYNLPTAFETISQEGYTSSGSWFTLTDQEALTRGFVSPYATSSPNEDFAETVAFYMFDTEFFETYIEEEEDCETAECIARNEGRAMIREKLNAIAAHYEQVTEVSLEDLREAVQSRL